MNNLELIKLPMANFAKMFMADNLNMVFVKGDDSLHSRGYDNENNKWGTVTISFCEEPNDDDALYMVIEFNDKEVVSIPFTPQVLTYVQIGLVNWLNDCDDEKIKEVLQGGTQI